MSNSTFSNLPIHSLATALIIESEINHNFNNLIFVKGELTADGLKLKDEWLRIKRREIRFKCYNSKEADDTAEFERVNWLIKLFNRLFNHHHVELVRGSGEPEYFPAECDKPARIEFAHGFFQSALHEISHWCIAGKKRRQLPDFGYWYAPDGRNEAQQIAFEQVEIKPQAIECLLSLICGRSFEVSQDNLDADFDTSKSTFAEDVLDQVVLYINNPKSLPIDAQILITAFALLSYDTIESKPLN